MSEVRHGTNSGWSHHGCRCDVCRTAEVARVRKWREANREKRRAAEQARRERIRQSGIPPTHGITGYTDYGCRCETCTLAARQQRNQYRKANTEKVRQTQRTWLATPNGRAHSRASALAYYRPRQQATRDGARRHGYVWTGPELEVATRTDLTSEQVAQMLGRSLAAVVSMRRKLKVDPRKQRLAGTTETIKARGLVLRRAET